MNDFLFSPTKQFIFPSGKILAGGKIYVFIKHTDNLATLYNDEDVEIANPVILDSNGRATVKADDTYDYKLDVYSPYDELLFTATSYLTDNFERDFAITSNDGSVDVNVSIDGYTTNWDLSVTGAVSGKLDTSAFENFYTNTYGPTIGNIYHKIDDLSGDINYLSATVSGGYGNKLDVTAFNLYSAGVRGDLNIITGNTAAISYNTAMLDDKILQNTNNINSVSGGLNTLYNIVIPEIRTDIIDVSSKVDSVSAKVLNKLDTTAFDDFINNSYSPNMSIIFNGIGSLKANKFDSSAFNAFINDSYSPNMSTIYQGLGNLSANKEDKITWSYNNDGEISAANGSALAGKGYYSKYAPYGVQATSGNLIIEGSRYPRQSLLEVSGENNVATAGIIPPVPEQNLSAVRYLVAASGSLADVSWKELPQIDTFSGVTTDSTLTGDGKNDPLGVADIQTLSSDESISITSGDNEVILGVNSSWFDNAVNSAYTGTTLTGDAQGAVDEVYANSGNYLKDTDLYIKTFEGIVSGVNAISGEQILPSALAPNTIQVSTGNGGSEFRFMPTASPWTTADAATGIFKPLMYATGACLTMSSGPVFKGYFKGNEWFVSNTGIGQAVRGEVHATRGARIWGAEVTGATSAEFILSARAGDAGLCLSNPTTSVEFGINSIVDIQTNSATWNEASAVSSKQNSLTFTYVEI